MQVVQDLSRFLVTPPESDLDLNLQSNFSHFLWINSTLIAEGSKALNAFREHIHKNQSKSNKRCHAKTPQYYFCYKTYMSPSLPK